MSKIYRCLFLLVSIAFLSTAASAQFRVKVKFSEIANLTYQLDCVGNLPINCSQGNLSELWKREFLQTDEDRQMLKGWKQLRELYASQIQIKKFSESSSYLRLFDKIRIAGFQAASVEDYAQRLDLLTVPNDRREFERVVRHFEPRFNLWWRREALKTGEQFAADTNSLLHSPKIAASLKQFYDFYSPILPENYEISFNLFFIPDAVKESSNGQQLQNYSLMEFKAKERPAQRIDIAVHELCHFFYDNISAEAQAKLAENFRSQNRAAATPAFNLLNETLATAFGNGIIARNITPPAEYEKYLAAKNSFYNNAGVDRAAKAVLPLLDDWLKKGKTINDADFAGQYISVLEKSFGADLLKPKLYLSEMFLFVDGKYSVSMRRGVRRTLETASFYAAEGSLSDENLRDFKSQPRLNSVFIIHPDNIVELARQKIISEAQTKQIQAEFEVKQSVLFSAERAPFTYIYIVVAKDADGAGKLIEKLAAAPQFSGIYRSNVSLDSGTTKTDEQKIADLRASIEQIAKSAGGKIGVYANLLETGETVSFNGSERFPMQSVFKLPVAMAVLRLIDDRKINLDQLLRVEKSDLIGKHLRSPIRDKYPDGTELSVAELLRLMVSESDGTAADVLLKLIGGPVAVNDYLRGLNIREINVVSNEKEIGADNETQYRNYATPKAAAALLQILQEGKSLSAPSRSLLLKFLIETPTGQKRLKGLLLKDVIVAHKTGTSSTVDGVTAATNDIGLITLPDGKHLVIAVFVSDSPADEATREAVIAQIARAVWDSWSGKQSARKI